MNTTPSVLPQVNGVVLAHADEALTTESIRQRACAELLRQAALQAGLLAADDPLPLGGAMTEAASTAIEALLDRELHVPEPSEEALRRHHAAQRGRYAVGERVLLRHVLFAVTPGVDVNALRQRAEACLLDVRCASPHGDDRFSAAALVTSNCPSGAEGGALGWLTTDDCAPELAREIFGKLEVGVLPHLVHSRFGLHVVEVLAREPGLDPAFEAVRSAVAQGLRQQAYATALRQYLRLLAGAATLAGVDLEAAESPLVQ
ncbi:MAG: peptidylprolyl isomerase [Burkholderiales bacterium]|nr:peptidylprolyl isomerase [Burkholderiales bacterium]MDE2565759.1 peptidylprolyl isomerase [Burkholderiales bacterium]